MSFQALTEPACVMLEFLSLLAPDGIPDYNNIRFAQKCLLEANALRRRVSGVIEELLSLSLVQRDANTDNISVHRLVQSEFRYHLKTTLQQRFQDASQLVYHAFPKQVFGRTFRPHFQECATLIQHVYSLRDHAEQTATGTRSGQHGDGLRPSKDFCRLMCNAAYYLVETGTTKELARMVDITMAAFKSTGLSDEDLLSFAHFCNSAALEREMNGDFAAAKDLLERARDIRCRELPSGHEDIWVVMNNLGNLNLSLGNYSEALRYHLLCQESVAMEVKDNVQMNWNNLGRCYTGLGRYSEAMGAFEKAKLVNGSELGFRTYYYWVGNMYMAQGNLDAAKTMYTEGQERLRAVGEAISADMAVCLYKLGLIALRKYSGSRAKEELDQAISHFREAITMMEFLKVADCEVARASYMLSTALLLRAGGEAEAAVWLEKAERVREWMQGTGYKAEAHGDAVYDMLVESWVR
ncbi:uncharacterized protein THITE_2128795 [Thermothielavioides terrestris NRRL 8126]|uniref:DUF7779 domain-containing protein n=1 Tax=Thermothielavioides terrestris (strain ATCC 38088 / NRRL 8126) TaxID=578455 RepID=G2R3I1_THETT|nr:uncharacterized protein THITE_2128795 [Thermothielavioides terrestris NRRL 8126]AEO66791.1 hypothetical protein THITE_2128795 [Thermothielavioides terrestris NRRL 8126]